jgi:undecaprenyl-diphosphatase
VKSLVFIGAALLVDLRHRSRPWRAALVTLSFALASWATSALKEVVARERPTGDTVIDLPSSYSFPSGHASTAFAAAVALSLLVPRAAVWALPLAGLVAYSRVYLGVHYWTDVLAGAVLGTLVAFAVVRVLRPPLARPRSRRRSARGSA